MAGFWVSMHGRDEIPSNAVLGGYDSNGEPLYIARSYHANSLLPGKYKPSIRKGYVSISGFEVALDTAELLIGDNYEWRTDHNGHVPSNAVRGGSTDNGEVLYIGRAKYENSLTPGKIHPSHGCLYIAYGGGEHKLTSYEVLVDKQTFSKSEID